MSVTGTTIDYRNIRVEDGEYVGLAMLDTNAMNPVLVYATYIFKNGLGLMRENTTVLGGLTDDQVVEVVTKQIQEYIDWYKNNADESSD